MYRLTILEIFFKTYAINQFSVYNKRNFKEIKEKKMKFFMNNTNGFGGTTLT